MSFWGCGVSVSQESARSAVENASSAVNSARDTDAESYSSKDMRAAEKFLKEAEQALSQNHRQRAYILANKSEKAAKSAELAAKRERETTENVVVKTAPTPATTKQTVSIPSSVIIPRGAEQTETQVIEKPLPTSLNISPQSNPQMSDIQNRIQAAALALDAAQKAVESAKLLIFKLQIDIDLSKTEASIKQMQDSNAPVEMINLVRTWYNQAQQAATLGNYESAMRLLQRIQTYAQVLTMPTQ
jgi:tetratricopeptide (TPR) repeat protein